MTYTTDNQQTVFYTLVAVLTTVALILVMCKQSGTAAAVSSISILAIVVEMTMRQRRTQEEVAVVAASGGETADTSSESTSATAKKAAAAEAAKKLKAGAKSEAGQKVKAAGTEAAKKLKAKREQAGGQDTTESSNNTGTTTDGAAEPTDTDTTQEAEVSASVSARRHKQHKQPKTKSRYSVNQIADVPGNEYVGVIAPEEARFYMKEPPRMAQECSSAKLVLPITMEGELPYGVRPEDYGGDNLTSCNGGIKTVPPLPPMPGLALPPPTGESIWRLPENVVDQCSREESIAAVVSGLPTCCQQTPMQAIRNQGLYGVKGNLSCDKLKRSAVADFNLLEPLGSRNAFLAYNSYDQLHAKDQFMIPIHKDQPE